MAATHPARTIAIGDIHGCARALETLLTLIAPQPHDVIITLGDYIDRGANSRGVIDRLLALEGECQFTPLVGNHEIMLLVAREDRSQLPFWLDCGGRETLASYGTHQVAGIPWPHWEFLSRCRTFFETERHFFVHANYEADTPLDAQPEDLLFWTHLSYHLPPRHVSGKMAIVGHTPQMSGRPLFLDHLACIDTHCCGSGWLTALNVNTGAYWQADEGGDSRTGHLYHPTGAKA